MNRHASINRVFRLIWNDALGSWVPAAEITRGRRKRGGRCAVLVVGLLAATGLGLSLQAHAAGPVLSAAPVPSAAPALAPAAAAATASQSSAVPAPTQLPTGGKVVAGSATISSNSASQSAVLDVDQTSQRAIINWNTFNLGSAAEVDFKQPGADSATLNRVLDSNPSQIFGRIEAPGQVFLLNPNGVYFGKSAIVDVGGLTASTQSLGDSDFMSGKITLTRGGSTGSVVNDGTLRASVGGYIALLAPEVRNSGVVIARMGTVVMAAGESITLDFDGTHLAGITAQPAKIAALVENRSAIYAPGGLIILSAKALDALQGGVVNNSGVLEATGLATKGGRIVLEASDSVANSGTITANAGADGSPAGSIEFDAGNIVQTTSGSLDVSGANGGSVKLVATQDMILAGNISAAAFEGRGGSIALTAGHNVTLQSVLLDTSGVISGGQITAEGGGTSSPGDPPTLALLGSTELRTSSGRGRGGTVTLTADEVQLLDVTSIDSSGAIGGGNVFVGGGFHGKDPSIANAQQLQIARTVVIDASATEAGNAGNVALWSDGHTSFAGDIAARGGAISGDGGMIEVSSKGNLDFTGHVNAGADHGVAGSLLLDPQNITVDASGSDTLSNETFATNPGTDSVIAPLTITAVTNTGTGVTLQANNDLTVNSSITTVTTAGATGGSLTFQAGRNITVNSSINSANANIAFSADDAGANGTYRASGNASFTNNGLINAGRGTVSITLGAQGASGSIETGQITAGNLNITHDGPTTGAVSGAIDLGETDITGNIGITANSARNITNYFGNVIDRGVTTISVGTGDVTLNGSATNIATLGVTAGNVLLTNAGAVQFATSNVSGSLNVTTVGPIGQTGPVQVTGATTLTANNGGFGYADPYISLTNGSNHFAGGLSLAVPGTGAGGTGGYATITDSGALNITSASVTTSLTLTTGGAITDSGAITVPGQTVVNAGSTNDITLNYASNQFNGMQIVAGHNVTIVDQNGITFGSYQGYGGYTSHVYGNLSVTAGSDIVQENYWYNDGYSNIQVDGATTFTANNPSTQINLYLGPDDPFGGYSGQSNSFAGGMTLAAANSNTGFANVQLRNTSATASAPTGLTSVGTLTNVYFVYDNAPSLNLPAMTVAGSLKVNAPSVANTATTSTNIISQAGPISVAQDTMVQAAASGDVVLPNASNDFNRVDVLQSGNTTIVNSAPVILYSNGYWFNVNGNLTVTAPGISDGRSGPYWALTAVGTATLNAGTSNISLTDPDNWNIVKIPAANNVTIVPAGGVTFDNSTIAGTLTATSAYGGTLTQVASSALNVGGTTSFTSFTVALNEVNNALGPIAIANAGNVSIRENAPITQASSWNDGNYITLTTSNDQAITLTQSSNAFGPLTLTQINSGATSPGAVAVTETANGYGMYQGSAWTIHGTTTLNAGGTNINLSNPNNVFGPLQVTGATVTIYAKNTATSNAITDVGGTGPWSTGATDLIAYDTTGATAGGGNITLTNTGNVMGNLDLKATNVTITENASITDSPYAVWDSANDTGWVTSGATDLIVANPSGKAISLSNVSNQIGPLGITTAGSAGTLNSVLITNNGNIAESSVWNVGAAPVTLDARTNQINLSTYPNVLGNISINTLNGTPTSVAITENAPITQGNAWVLPSVPVTLVAQNNNSITLTSSTNVVGNLTVTGGAVSITENANITQGGAWTTTGTTTLNPTANAITLANANNVLGPVAISGSPTSVSLAENADITQASAWVQASTPFTLDAGTHNIVLSQASNQLGALTLTAQNATVTENNSNGITEGGAWTIPGTTTLTAGNANPIVLNANPANNLGTVSIVSASNATIDNVGGIVFGPSTIASGGLMTVSSGGAITQTGAITAPSLLLIGAGNATLNNTGNTVSNLAAGFSGGDLQFTNSGDFAIASIGQTSGVTIGAHNVTLTSVNGTVTGLPLINAGSGSLTITTGTALTLPQMTMAGPQTYTASTVSGPGITLTAGITGTAAGAITFESPVTLSADLTIQSSNSAINFASTVAGGTNLLTVNAGTGLVDFHGAVSALGQTTDATVALALSSGGASFDSTLAANNGLAVTGPVTFNDTVTLAQGDAGSVFSGLVTLNKPGGMTLSAYNGLSFDGGLLLQSGPATINSNNSPLAFQTAGTVSGPYALTLNAGTQTLTGLDRMGGNLTGLTVTARNPTTPAGGISIAGPQTYTATAGSVIAVNGNVTSTVAGAITFNSPASLGADSTVASTNSPVVFAGTVDGNSNLAVNAGTGATTFSGAVGFATPVGTGTGAAIVLQGSGTTTFDSTIQTRSGMTAQGPVVFTSTVALGKGDTGSTFSGLVTSGGASGNSLSGNGGLTFNGGLTLTGGPVSVTSNSSPIAFGGPVTGAESLTLDALSGGAGSTVTGLNEIGTASGLTGLAVSAATLSLPSTGLAVAGPMTFTAPGGITLNGAVGTSSAPATGQISFQGPVSLATQGITVSTANAPIGFGSTVDGAEALAVNSGTNSTTFGGAVGGTRALASLTTNASGTAAINGGSITTTGAQNYGGAVTLGADSTLTGGSVQFSGTLDGAHALTVDSSGATTFAGVVGGSRPLTSITTDAPGTVAIDTTAITTSGPQSYGEPMTLGANASFTGTGITFGGTLDGANSLTAAAGTGALVFGGAVGAVTMPTSVTASGNTISAGTVTTSGSQGYTAPGGTTLAGNLTTTDAAVTVTGPTTLGSDITVNTSGGNISFSGATSTVQGTHALTLQAGTGNVVLGAALGGVAPLTSLTISGYDLSVPNVTTVGGGNQSYTALDNITLTQNRTAIAPLTFTADANGSGNGAFIMLTGVSLTTANTPVSIQAADINLQGSSTISSGNAAVTLTATDARNIALGGSSALGQMTITGDELSRLTTAGGLNLDTTGSGWIHVNGITAPQSQNITGTLTLNAQGTGDVSFISAPSTFNALTADASGGNINIGVNLTTNDTPIDFMTAAAASGTATINSGGANISFDSTLSVANNLTVSTGGGRATFSGAVGGNAALTLNLVGGPVTGLSELQSTLTGLTVNSTSAITLPALTISGPQVYNTGTVTLTGDLAGTGITFNELVNVVPASGNALTLNAGTGTLSFDNLARFNAVDMVLIGDGMTFSAPITGTGGLTLQPYTSSVDVAINGTGTPIVGLNLNATNLAWLPINTLSSLTIGDPTGSGTLDVAGVLNVPGTPVTLNGGGGITQSGGSVTSGPLTLYAAGNAINLGNGANAFGAVAINGAPSSVSLANTLDITQFGSAGWNLGSAPVTLNAGAHNITLNNAGNSFGTMVLNGSSVQVTEASAADIGASSISGNLSVTSGAGINVSGALVAAGNVSLNAAGEVTQSAPLTIGGNLGVVTTANAGDVTIDNSGASTTTLGDTLVGGNYVLTATSESISQAPGAAFQVRGNVTVSGGSIVLGNAANLVGGTTTLPGASTVYIAQAGVITLGNRTDVGNLTVVSERTNRTFSSSQVSGPAIVLDNAANNVQGRISVSASPPTVVSGSDVQTGINQATGTSISVAGIASFTAEASSAGTLGINLTNSGNNFGTLVLNGSTVNVTNSASGLTTIGAAQATTSLTLTTAGGVAQTGVINTPALAITSAGSVTLNNVVNEVSSLSVTSGGNPIGFVNAGDLSVAGIDAGGSTVSLTAGGSGSLTQSGALLNASALTVNAGGGVTLTNSGNTITALAASSAATGFQLFDANGIAVTGTVGTSAGDLLLRASGDLTLNSGGRLEANAGNLVASTEGAGNFINNSASGGAALIVGGGDRWLVYSETPDLIAGPHTVKGGLTSSFRDYGATYTSYSPGSVTEAGDGYVYSAAVPTLTVGATISGPASQVYGDTPTGSLSYAITGGFADSEDTVTNVIRGGAATYSMALANTLNAGVYDITYTGGLMSNYTLVPSVTGAMYTVTQAVLTYTANAGSRLYGAANPAMSGTIAGFKLGQTAAVLTGSPTWTTSANASSDVGQYAIDGGGYVSNGNYSFAQAAGNATALTINRAPLTVTASNDTKTYDATVFSGGAGVTYSGFVNSENASVLGGAVVYGGTSQGARNAGAYSITPSGLTSGNYSFTYDNGTLQINKANLDITTSDVTKTYNGTLSAVGSPVAAGGTQLFGSDTLSGGTFAFTNANAGAADKTVNVSGVTVSDGNGGGNYVVAYANNTTSTIDPAGVTVSAANITKTYDGTVSATGTPTLVAGTLFHNVSNGNAQDSLSGGTFAFADPNAGSGNKAVTVSGVTVNDGNSGGNYAVTYANNTTSTINRAPLTVTASNDTETYDATAFSGGAGVTYSGFVNGQNASVLGGAVVYGGTSQGARNAGAYSITPSGLTSGNYSFAYDNGTLQINKANLDITTSDVTKTYDGTLSAAGTAVSTGGTQLFGSDTLSGGTFAFTNANAGTADKTVTVGGVAVNDGDGGGNYTVSYVNNTASTINPASLTVASANVTKTYDSTVSASGTAVVVGGTLFHNASNGNAQDSLSGGTFAFTDPNAGVGNKTVTAAGATVSDGNGGGNYVVTYADNTTSTINSAPVTFTATIADKTYDGTTAATVSGYSLSGLIDNQTLGADTASAAFSDKNAGVGKTVGISGITLTNGTNGGLATNYVVAPTATSTGTIDPKMLTVDATVANKVYDGTTAAQVVSYGLSGFAGNETVTAASTGTSTFSDKNVGTGKTVTIAGIDLVNGTNGGLASNYTVPGVATTTADITPATLRVSGIVGVNKVYDGTVTADLNTQSAALIGVIGSDQVGLGPVAGGFLTKDVGTNKPIDNVTFSLTGADGMDYTVIQPSGLTASITPRPLTVTATGVNKVYDGTTAEAVTLANNAVAGDVVTATSIASFMDKNVGSGKYVGVSDITLSGADAQNYTANTTTSTFANITPVSLVITTAAANKVYDGTTGATVTLSDSPLGGDVVSLNYSSSSFANKNAGTGKVVTVSGISASGPDAGDYTISPTVTTTANITPAPLAVTATGVNRVYDGTTGATVTLSDSPLAGDIVYVNYSSASFAGKNAGTGKVVTVGGLTAGGADAGDYTISPTVTTTANITPAPLAVTATGVNRVYNGTTGATVTLSDTPLAGDLVNVNYSSASFADKNAGTGKVVTVGGLTASGADAGDYAINPTATTTANITPAPLAVTATGVNRVYDGTTGATVTLSDSPLAGDVVNVNYSSASFANKNVGNGKTVSVSGISVSGPDANDYAVNTTATTPANITPATLAVGAIGQSRIYDGTTNATVVLTDNPIPGDQVTASDAGALFLSPTAGNGKTILVEGIQISGPDSGNYVLANTATTTTANIFGTVTTSYNGTWSLPPVLPPPWPTVIPTAAPAVVDARLPPIRFVSVADASAADGGATGAVTAASADDASGASGANAGSSGASGSSTAGTTGPSKSATTTNSNSGGTTTSTAEESGTPGTTSATAGTGSDGTVGSATNGDGAPQVTVSVVQAATAEVAGEVSVSVPETIVSSGNGFSFPLPAAVAEAAASGNTTVTLANGKRLPRWLRYVSDTRSFVANAAPAGALPVEVLVRTGSQRWTVVITLESGH
jgi:filamentous hemagglutinin family protein